MNRFDFVTNPSRVQPRKKRKIKKRIRKEDKYTKSIGRTWSGRWNDGTLGWGIGPFVDPYGTSIVRSEGGDWFWKGDKGTDRDKVFLCEVVIKQIFDKNGRPIVRHKSRMRQ